MISIAQRRGPSRLVPSSREALARRAEPDGREPPGPQPANHQLLIRATPQVVLLAKENVPAHHRPVRLNGASKAGRPAEELEDDRQH